MSDGPISRTVLARLVEGEGLEAHFQPIAALRDGSIFGYEGLIRGPAGELRNPVELFDAIRAHGLGLAFEVACARTVVRAFAELGMPGQLAVNFSGPNIERLVHRSSDGLAFLLDAGIEPERIVIELTEHERVADPLSLKAHAAELRALGMTFAIDDFGDGHSSLRLWAELAPEIVKIDKYFIGGVHREPSRFQCVKALLQLGEVFGTRLVAEGIEDEADLRVLRDLGIELGQGYLLGEPRGDPDRGVRPEVAAALRAPQIAVYPELVKMPMRQSTIGDLAMASPVVAADTPNNRIADIFTASAHVHAVAVVRDGKPVGIVNRRTFMDRYAQPYYRELYGKRPCTTFMNAKPLLVDRAAPIESIADVLSGADQTYLADGLVLHDGGRYAGLVTGAALVRAVAELRVEAARYANPLTFLPGNIPITAHIERLIASGVEFTACYSDLNHFKPFNDQYGYWRGDQMIKLAARCIRARCDPLRDFIGHVGGDDFVILFQSTDWRARCEAVIAEFDRDAAGLYDETDRRRGGIEAEDRQGRMAFFGLTTLSIGALTVRPGDFRRPEDVASRAAIAKREAKHRGVGFFDLTPAGEPAPAADYSTSTWVT
jgi:diguanylate cyclase (GGDEF)-like protein